MDIAVSRDWTFLDAVKAARERYFRDSLYAASCRTQVLRTWGNVVGRDRALHELGNFIRDAGSVRKAAAELDMAPSTLRSLRRYYETLLQIPQRNFEPVERLVDRALQFGESEEVELTARIPRQARDLAKEVAAFASSGGGAILLGIDDDRSIVGLADSHERIEGLAQIVQPVPNARVSYLERDGREIAVIVVEGGPEPLYYVGHRPYVRDGSLSRPATPDEVIRSIRDSG